ncbi:lactonase family protein [Hymenobacter weizhouensis]|uniref:lactonase family protein n=1 Tax=Hymenobacter sp. YIM 151500-1 TaxID=2987689 RepID=UPI0022262F4D|nr:lactonase family protein [Hymenobacter sp. YIM 151500-1]UYZ63974.1 lactonase family protein [Hymenobacter sp. YIM 151500-1]
MADLSSSRREFLKLAGLGLAGWPVAAAAGGTRAGRPQPAYLVYVGTYARPDADSIFLFRLDPKTGALTRLRAEKAGENPSFLALAPGHRYLYAANEVSEYQGAPSGFVSAFAIDPRTGGLTPLNQQPSGGAGPCYLRLDGTGRAALVANYGGGSVSLLPVAPTGPVQPPAATHPHRGAGPNPDRQTAPHAHCIIPDPAGRFAFAVDLGTDQVLGYQLDAAQGRLTPLAAPAFTARPGAGPRHLTFHPNGRWAYLINELTSSVSALAYDAGAGTFRELHTLSALPAGFTGANTCADIHVAPNGRFVYASNRGHDSLVVFAVAPGSGRLTVVQHMSTQGKTPRNFALDPSGTILLAANQNSNTIVTFRINAQTGQLTPTGRSAEVPAPVCLQVVPDFTAK